MISARRGPSPRLEHEDDVAGEFMADLVQDLGGSDEAGDVEVVTARVHDTGHGRGPRVRDLLGDRQAVHVPTQQDDRALCQIWPTLAAQDRHDRGRVGAEGDLEVQTRQRPRMRVWVHGLSRPSSGRWCSSRRKARRSGASRSAIARVSLMAGPTDEGAPGAHEPIEQVAFGLQRLTVRGAGDHPPPQQGQVARRVLEGSHR